MPRSRNTILDFDGTITTLDTISILASFALSHQTHLGHDFQQAWSQILSHYSRDYTAHATSYLPMLSDRRTLAQEISYYQSLRGTEMRSLSRVSESAVFKGISGEAWRAAGRKMVGSSDIIIRPGFRDFVMDVQGRGGRCAVISVNFSRDYIQGVLDASIGSAASDIEIIANVVDEEGIIYGPGREDGEVMATSDAKLAAMRKLLTSWDENAVVGVGTTPKPVYIGDSGTDIECLVSSQVFGIIMCSAGQSNLIDTLQRVQVRVERCSEFSEVESNTLFWASDFNDVNNSLLMCNPPSTLRNKTR